MYESSDQRTSSWNIGTYDQACQNFLSELGRSLMLATGDNRKTYFFYQRLSITIQRFNSVAFQGTLPGLYMGKTNFLF